MVNQTKVKQAGKKWVSDGIITEEQLEKILATYTKRDSSVIIILFAVLLTGLGFLTFIFSEWAQVPHFSRTIIIIAFMVGLYILGDILFRKHSTMLGISFIVLGYIIFGAGLLLTIDIYGINLYSAWPFIIWSVIGLLLYFIYEHKLLFVIGIIVTTIGQMYSGLEFHSFNVIILLIFILGFTHFVYHHSSSLFGYIFGLSFALQMLILTMAESQQYYWLIIYFLVLYIAGELIAKEVLKTAFKNIGLLSIFIFSMYQTFLLQEEFFVKEIKYQISFLIVWVVLIGLACLIKYMQKQQYEWIDFILFLPVFFLPYSYFIGLVTMFVFSIGWLLIGYQQENHEKIMLGTIGFLLSTFTVYIQYAWDAMNKSLFFLIGGVLLFVIGFLFEKQRRAILDGHQGGARK